MPSKFSQNIVPLIIACALFMENLDSSIIATAIPSIARSLHTNPIHLNLAITSYMFSLAVFIPLSGWVADRFGARLVFRAAILIFMCSSVGCGLSHSLVELIAFRLLQGMGGAMMVPVGRLVLLRSVPKAGLVSAMTWVTVPALIGPVLGPPVGGFIVTYSSWHWIFFVNLPIGVLGIILTTLFIKDIRESNPGPLDMSGFLLMATALAGLVCGFETVGRDMLPDAVVTLLLVGGAVFLALYVRHAHRTEHPIVDIRLFRIPTFLTATVGGLIFRIGIGALPFLLPMMLQLGFGLSAVHSGMLTFASAAGAMLMKMTATRILRTYGFRRVLVTNTCIASGFLLGIALFRPTTPYYIILGFLLLGGFFRSLQFTSLNTLTYADIPTPLMSKATTLGSMLQQLSLSLGVGTGALLLHCTLRWQGTTQLGPNDFWPAIVGVSIISSLSVLFFLRLTTDAGAEVSGYSASATLPAVHETVVKRPDPS
jgi:EmrB/QacA subfamily drug resistance transporter